MIVHEPVLVDEILENLPFELNYGLDGTLGHGGHVNYLLQYLEKNKSLEFEKVKIAGVDRDKDFLEKAKTNLEKYKNKINFVNSSYASFDHIYENTSIDKFDYMLLDLGVNMGHLKEGSRGFSIKEDAHLDMRYDTEQKFDASKLISTYSQNQLQEILIKYGDFSEGFAKKMSEEITVNKKKMDLTTTLGLKSFLKEKFSLGEKKIAVVFQVLRIEVNNELGELETFLENFSSHLQKGGRCFIITYHSIEDRIVKNSFKELDKTENFSLVNKKVITPTQQEIKKNKAARSAKLRIIQAL